MKLVFGKTYELPPGLFDSNNKRLVKDGQFLAYNVPNMQPKRLWDALNAFEPVQSINGARSSLAAFRRAVADNVFMYIFLTEKTSYSTIVSSLPVISETKARPRTFTKEIKPAAILSTSKAEFSYILKEDVEVHFDYIIMEVDGDFIAPPQKTTDLFTPEAEWVAMLNNHQFNGMFRINIKEKRSYAPEYAKIRSTIKKEYGKDNIYRWQNLCKEMNIKSKASELRQWAKTFGVPPQYWNQPREICALITPRVDDYKRKVVCDNDDEYTMEGDAVGDIPEFLKYTHFDPNNGKRYCYSVLDLFNSYKSAQKGDPYRRFQFTPEIIADITDRVEFIKSAIEPRGYGEGIMSKIQNSVIALLPGQQVKARLVNVWSKLRYPKLSIEEVMSADISIVNGLMAAITRQDGLSVTQQERLKFTQGGDVDAKRAVVIDVMNRIANIEDPSGTNLVALEMAINESTPQGTVRGRDEDDFDELALEGNLRAAPRAHDSENDDESEDDDDSDDEDDVIHQSFHNLGPAVYFEEFIAAQPPNPNNQYLRNHISMALPLLHSNREHTKFISFLNNSVSLPLAYLEEMSRALGLSQLTRAVENYRARNGYTRLDIYRAQDLSRGEMAAMQQELHTITQYLEPQPRERVNNFNYENGRLTINELASLAPHISHNFRRVYDRIMYELRNR